MKLHEIKNSNSKNIKRVGRGISAGGGKTAGRGTKGQNSRAGHNIPNKFEGGQMPLSMRLPKLPGFKSFSPKMTAISFDLINKYFKDGEELTNKALRDKNLLKNTQIAKILSNGELKVKIKLGDVKVSKKALEIIEKISAAQEKKVAKPVKTAKVNK